MDDMFTDGKGHRIDTFYKTIPSKNEAGSAETARFIREMSRSNARRHRLSLSKDVIIYVIIAMLMGSVLLVDFGENKTIVKIEKRTLPLIYDDVNISRGMAVKDDPGWQEWWALSLNTSCSGIDSIYSGEGFVSDWEAALVIYNRQYSSNGGESIYMMTPDRLYKNVSNYDCEDFAHATRCLAEKYDVECNFWTKENVGPIVPNTKGHLGVCCLTARGWRCI